MVLTFRYHIIPEITNELKKPTIPVEFKMKSGGYIEVMCLVDSGADVVVLPKGIAELLGIKLHDKSTSTGIGGDVPIRKGTASFQMKKQHRYYDLTVPVEVMETDDIQCSLEEKDFLICLKLLLMKKIKK